MIVNPFRLLKKHYGWDMGKVKRFLKWAYGTESPAFYQTPKLWNDLHGEVFFVGPDADVALTIIEQGELFDAYEQKRLAAAVPR